jgi:CBS-domain-containing membrane protein
MYELLQETVASNMTRRVRHVAPEMTVGDLYRLFAAEDFEAYPVVRNDRVVGMVSKLDALKVFAFATDQILPHYMDGMGTTVDEIMTLDVVSAAPETSLQRALQLMIEHRVKSLPVIDEWRHIVGIIAREDVMRAMERCTVRQEPPIVPFEATRCLASA